MKKIKYTPMFEPEDLRQRIASLSEALSKVLGALQCLEDCGASEIADDEAIFVQEVMGFYELVKLVEEEEYTAAIKSVNKACWEIEVAKEEGGKDIDHPWLGEPTGGCFETNTFCSSWEHSFDHRNYGPTPKEQEEQRKWDEEWEKRRASEPPRCASQLADELENF